MSTTNISVLSVSFLPCKAAIIIWSSLCDESDIEPTDLGWNLIDGKLFPIYTDKPPAPDELLCLIACKCKTDCRSQQYSCRKRGLNCSSACYICQGKSCTIVSCHDLHIDSDCSEEDDD